MRRWAACATNISPAALTAVAMREQKKLPINMAKKTRPKQARSFFFIAENDRFSIGLI
jgi:hypothetical protein